MQRTEPLSGEPSVVRHVAGIRDSFGILEEEPARVSAGVLDRAVAADRGQQDPREDLFVDPALETDPFEARLFGDHVLAVRAGTA